MRHAQNGYTDASMWQAWERSGLAGLCAGILARSGLDKATAQRHILPMEKPPVSAHAVPVALARCEGYDRRSLDQLVGEVLDTIASVATLGITMIIVTHEMAFARDVADQVIFMDGGFIVEQGDPKQVIDHPQEERTKQFLAHYSE